MKMSFSEYDIKEEICDKIYVDNKVNYMPSAYHFEGALQFPTIEQMEALNVDKNLTKYFNYLFYFYTQDFEEELMHDSESLSEYRKAKKYISKLLMKNLKLY